MKKTEDRIRVMAFTLASLLAAGDFLATQTISIRLEADFSAKKFGNQFSGWLGAATSEHDITVRASDLDISQALIFKTGVHVNGNGRSREQPVTIISD